MPTPSQIEYIGILCNELGYDPQDYDLDNMNQSEITDLIDQLKDELGW